MTCPAHSPEGTRCELAPDHRERLHHGHDADGYPVTWHGDHRPPLTVPDGPPSQWPPLADWAVRGVVA